MIDDLQVLALCEMFLLLPSWAILFAFKCVVVSALGGWIIAGVMAFRWVVRARWKCLPAALLLWALGNVCSHGAGVIIAWDPSPSSTVTNYTVHVAPAGSPNGAVLLQAGTNTTQTITLAAGDWEVWVTAVSISGIRSEPSNILQLKVPAPPVIRLQLQGAADLNGPWQNITSIVHSVTWITNAPLVFYRGKLEWE